MPGYFRFVTLLAFHAFLSLKVDATVLEVGVGGTYDSTNIVPRPVVTGVTALGIDHVAVLGKTLQDIAWQKSGIFKEGVPAFTVVQPEEGLRVLEQRANELKASEFTILPPEHGLSDIELGLAGAHQKQNAALAVELARRPVRVLVFNCTSGRSGPAFLGSIVNKLSEQLKLHKTDEVTASFFDHVIFCTNVTYADGHFKGDLTTLSIPTDDLAELKTQHQLATAWSSLVPTSQIHVLPSIEHAMDAIDKIKSSESVKVLVTGSLHLVGGVIEVSGLSDAAL
ncbi:hypothetical protein DXG03_000282 [Asterophora parasitica]|uniref:tetrahydrofolate synthase n=1 Tax=Asterophora parasitica TaxID=117018 RepID=A0A9P7GI07_9AGAR|nr:hypothetical protein DXG03_000282 [Asterophora parasitica]